ncbi:hypothetical protein D3Z36_02870 [Lachnospiraceae bacterium]|nr:hypothetical protein [Lachnospiraceae bacterium]
MKKQKVLMIMALVGMLAVTPSSSAFAAAPMQTTQAAIGNEIQPRYVNTANIAASVKIEGSTAYAYSTVTAKRVCHVDVTMRLQRYTGSGWLTVCSWIESSDNGTKTMSKSYSLTTRGTYRVSADFNVAGEKLNYTSISKVY